MSKVKDAMVKHSFELATPKAIHVKATLKRIKSKSKGNSMDLKSKFDKITPFVSNPFHFVSDKLINNKLIGKNNGIVG